MCIQLMIAGGKGFEHTAAVPLPQRNAGAEVQHPEGYMNVRDYLTRSILC